jgi:hypothetical protein
MAAKEHKEHKEHVRLCVLCVPSRLLADGKKNVLDKKYFEQKGAEETEKLKEH